MGHDMHIIVNGKKYTVPKSLGPDTLLSDYLRKQLGLTGTKVTSKDGACGSSVVVVTKKDVRTGAIKTKAIHSCLASLETVTDCHVTTVEGIRDCNGPHEIQTKIAESNASQCGYCAPGLVMSLYGILAKKKVLTSGELEVAFDGNVCRCTGYRAILETAKSFSCAHNPVNHELLGELHKPPHCGTGTFHFNDKVWHRPKSMDELLEFAVTAKSNGHHVKLVAGQVCEGIMKDNSHSHEVTINVSDIPEMNEFRSCADYVHVGAAVTIQELIDNLDATASQKPGFSRLADALCPYLEKIGNTPMRNACSWVGQVLSMRGHKDYPSDLFTLFDALGATIKIASKCHSESVTMQELMEKDLSHEAVVSIKLPMICASEAFWACKVMPRKANVRAELNCAFYAKLCGKTVPGSTIVHSCRIAIGGLSAKFSRATKTEALITGKGLSKHLCKNALSQLEHELVIGETLVQTSREYREGVARNLFYRFMKNLLVYESKEEFYLSLQTPVELNRSRFNYDRAEGDEGNNVPMPRNDAIIEACGEAKYTADMASLPWELHGALVLSKYARANVAEINGSKALALEGVHHVLTMDDIKAFNGNNAIDTYKGQKLEVLACGHVDYAGQPVALVLADTKELADKGVQLVEVRYTDVKTPTLHIRDAIKDEYFHQVPCMELEQGSYDEDAVKYKLAGEIYLDSQYHCYNETQAYLCRMEEDKMEVWATTQAPGKLAQTLHHVTGKPMANINVNVSRLGGAYGGKYTSSLQLAPLAAIGTICSNRPVRLELSLEDCQKVTGKRYPVLAKYKVGVDKCGCIKAVEVDLYMDMGYYPESSIIYMLRKTIATMDCAYNIPCWKLRGYAVKTDKQHAQCMTGPDVLPTTYIMDQIMNDVANALNQDPDWKNPVEAYKIKEAHFIMDHQKEASLKGEHLHHTKLQECWDRLHDSIHHACVKKHCDEFNMANKWKKRGYEVIPCKYILDYPHCILTNASIAIYHHDGTVVIQQGGVEMGQGLNAKVVHWAARELGVPEQMIKLRPVCSAVSADNMPTFEEMGEEMAYRSVIACCKILRERLDVVQKGMGCKPSWLRLVQEAHHERVDLCANYSFTEQLKLGGCPHTMYGAMLVQSEVDMLTGESTVLEMDAVFDVLRCHNVQLERGQIESALIMGMGYALSEEERYDTNSGELLSTGHMAYRVPSAMDIPRKMNITLINNMAHHDVPSQNVAQGTIVATPAFLCAVRNAIAAFRQQEGISDSFTLQQPATLENVYLHGQIELKTLLDDFDDLTVHEKRDVPKYAMVAGEAQAAAAPAPVTAHGSMHG